MGTGLDSAVLRHACEALWAHPEAFGAQSLSRSLVVHMKLAQRSSQEDHMAAAMGLMPLLRHLLCAGRTSQEAKADVGGKEVAPLWRLPMRDLAAVLSSLGALLGDPSQL